MMILVALLAFAGVAMAQEDGPVDPICAAGCISEGIPPHYHIQSSWVSVVLRRHSMMEIRRGTQRECEEARLFVLRSTSDAQTLKCQETRSAIIMQEGTP